MATGRGKGTAGLEGKQSPSSLGLLLPWASSGTSSPTQLLLLLATLSATLSLLPVFIHSLEGVPGRLSLPQDRQLWQLSPPQVRGQRHSSTSDLHTPTAATGRAQLQREGKQSPAWGVAAELQSCREEHLTTAFRRDKGPGATVLGQREGRELLTAWPWTLLCFPAFRRLQQQLLPAPSPLSAPRLRTHCHGQKSLLPYLLAKWEQGGRAIPSSSQERGGQAWLGAGAPGNGGERSRTPR